MKSPNKDPQIQFETALLAAEKGFDWETGELPYMVDGDLAGKRGGSILCTKYVPSCTQTCLQRWLREVHNIHISISTYHCLGLENPFGLGIDYQLHGIWTYADYDGPDQFRTYEEALERGLIESLKLINQE